MTPIFDLRCEETGRFLRKRQGVPGFSSAKDDRLLAAHQQIVEAVRAKDAATARS